jgi:nitrogen fixation NifU-like protein
MYSQQIIDRFKNPKNAGSLRGANGVGKVGNAACGDIMKMYLKISDEGIIEDAKFKTFGCCAAIASTDVACDLIKGKTIDEALKVTNKDVFNILGTMPAHKIHCSVLAEETIRDAIEDYYKRKEKENKAK